MILVTSKEKMVHKASFFFQVFMLMHSKPSPIQEDSNQARGVEISWFFYHSVFKWNFMNSKSATSTILAPSETLNFNFHELLHFDKAENCQISQIQSPKNMATMVFLELLDFPKLISRKI